MKNKFLIVLISILILVIIIILVSYINHKLKSRQEKHLLKTSGKIVNINNHDMNVYISGNENSEVTLVFMSGAGTCSPTLDFKKLYTLFEKDYQIAVVERAGYGYSQISDVSRDIDTVLDETRQALHKAGINNKFVLFPHSMSGIEALYWANKYPEEIKGIIGLDPAVPEAYNNMNISNIVLDIVHFMGKIGIMRFFPFVVDSSSAIKYGDLTEEEKQIYRAIFYSRFETTSMLNESKTIKKEAEKLAGIDNTEVPLLFFASNGEGTGFDKEKWHSFIINYINSKENGKYVLLDCSHYVHNLETQKIYEKSVDFLQNVILYEI